jgi:serine/threonine-protein kinase
MEFLEGRDLRQLMIKKHSLSIVRIVEIIAAVADGLAYAHENGVVHRDIKPANIMVLDNGTVKIADFGIAQIQSGTKTLSNMIVGTSKYMSPEHIMGLPVDGRTDIFSLGVVLYQLLAGVAPFEGETVTTIMYRVIHEAAAPPSLIADGIPDGFEYILAKALAKTPEHRYQTAAEFALDLRHYEALARTPRLPWTVGGLADPKPSSVGPDTSSPRKGTLFDEETIRIVPPVIHPYTKAESTSSNLLSSVLSEPTDLGSTRDSLTTHEPKSPGGSGYRLLLAALGILLLIGASVFMFTLTPEKAVQNSGTHSIEAAKEAPPLVDAPPLAAVPDKVEPVVVTPPVVALGTATLTLAIAPWGEIYIDGQSTGFSPPMLTLEITAGKHKIEIKNDGASSYSTDVELKAGEVKRLKYKF